MASIVIQGDTSGSATIAAPAVAGTPTLTLPTTSGTLLTTASTTGINGSAISSGTVAEAYGGTGTSTGYYGFKNRIINGAMMIDQRNAGASATPADGAYTLDRWTTATSQASKFTIQQNAGSVTPPSGFNNYLGLTVGASANVTVGSTDYFGFGQYVEGFNAADLGFGAAGASTVTLSFWVRSSLTGTFGGVLRNSAANRSYPFTYTISASNTWEQKAVTIAGDTTGTWLKTNGIGAFVFFSIGMGSTYTDTAGAWTSKASTTSATGSTNLITTNSATFYITGVQLEKGSTATSFDYRPYGTELALCQRYYEVTAMDVQGSSVSISISRASYTWKVTKRTNPTVTVAGGSTYTAVGQFVDGFNAYYSGTGYVNIPSGTTAAAEL